MYCRDLIFGAMAGVGVFGDFESLSQGFCGLFGDSWFRWML